MLKVQDSNYQSDLWARVVKEHEELSLLLAQRLRQVAQLRHNICDAIYCSCVHWTALPRSQQRSLLEKEPMDNPNANKTKHLDGCCH